MVVDLEVALALELQVEPAMLGQAVSMWSRKPSPVSISAVPVAVQEQLEA